MDKNSIGRYKLIRHIASGGMADIYRAIMTGPHNFEKLVALKMIHKQLTCDPAFVTMFTDEARISARLVHPNIVQITDFGEIDKRLYIAMEYVDGVDLSRFIKLMMNNNIHPQLELSIHIIMEILNALEYTCSLKDAHGESFCFVHRDITPQNILLSYDGDVKLTDFGIAKVRGSIATTTAGTLKGKIRYMSPEQARGEEVDHRSDLYSIALVLYELITHKQAYPGGTDMMLLKQVQSSSIEYTPLQLNPSIPYDLDAIVMKALSSEPDDRFYEPGALKKALGHYVQNSASAKSLLSEYLRRLLKDQMQEDRDGIHSIADNNQDKKKTSTSAYTAGTVCVVIFAICITASVHYKITEKKIPALSSAATGSGMSIPAGMPQTVSAIPVPRERPTPEQKQSVPDANAVLVINAIPWADVYIADKITERFAGTTPVKFLKLSAGSHALVFKNRIYGTKVVKIKVSSGEKKTIVLKYDQATQKFTRTIR